MIALLQNLQKKASKMPLHGLFIHNKYLICCFYQKENWFRNNFFTNIAFKPIDILKKYINDHCYWLSSAIFDGQKYQCIVILFPWDLRQLRHRVHWQSGWHVWGAAEQYLFLGKPKTRTKQRKLFKLGMGTNKAR